MKKVFQLAFLCLATACLTGCTTPYMVDRGRDTADIFTATVGEGSGLKVQVGPLAIGLFGNIDTYGLRGGQIDEFICNGYDGYSMLDFNVLIIGGQTFVPKNAAILRQRHKCYDTVWGILMQPRRQPKGDSWSRGHLYSLTQIEIAGGVGRTFRLGFNPGELLDFILGWTTLDIYNDDLGWKNRESNKELENTCTNAPDSPQ